MKANTLIQPDHKRVLAPPFAWIDRRFLFDGFLAALSAQENLLYFFLVLVADRDGVSFYNYDKICTLLKLDVEAYVHARDGLIQKQLIAFDGQRFQVLALPQSRVAAPAASRPCTSSVPQEAQALREIFAHAMHENTLPSSSAQGPEPERLDRDFGVSAQSNARRGLRAERVRRS